MQVVAVYYEEKVKTYGLNQIKGLSLISSVIDLQDNLANVRDTIDSIQDQVKFLVAMLEETEGTKARLYFLVSSENEKKVVEFLNAGAKTSTDAPGTDVISPVELVYFQGPHFGDRWGIAYNAFGALRKGEIRALVAALSGAAIFLVFPESTSDKAVLCLKEVFEVP